MYRFWRRFKPSVSEAPPQCRWPSGEPQVPIPSGGCVQIPRFPPWTNTKIAGHWIPSSSPSMCLEWLFPSLGSWSLWVEILLYRLLLRHPVLVSAGSSFYHITCSESIRGRFRCNMGARQSKNQDEAVPHYYLFIGQSGCTWGLGIKKIRKSGNISPRSMRWKSVLDITHALFARVFYQRQCQERMLFNSMDNLTLWISFILLHQYIPSTMHLATLVCFCISAASAVKHYGLTPAEDVKNMVGKSRPGVVGKWYKPRLFVQDRPS